MKILITGATSGIGFLTGVTLSNRGHKVIMTTRTDKDLKLLQEKIKKLNLKNIETYRLDISNSEDKKLIEKKDFDVLINNAAIGIGGSIVDLEISKIKENFEINVFSTIELTKMFCNKKIEQNKNGKIIILSSIAGYLPIEFLGSYSATKAALIAITKALRKELKILGKKIDINLIIPGAYKTGFNQIMIDSVFNSIDNKSIFYNLKSKIYNMLNIKFNIIEKRKLESIVSQIILAVECDSNRFIYSAPLLQNMIKKVYLLICG